MSEMIETNNSKVLNHGNDTSPNFGEERDPSVAGLPNTSPGHKIKSVTAELEKRRAELIALARAAEVRAREAEEKCEQIETKLEQEANQRLEAEHRLKELEEERLRQLQAAEIESVKTLKAALEHERAEVEAKLNEAEERIKAAENKAEGLTLALAEAERKRAEAENLARVARDDAREIESLFAGAEARLKEVESRLIEAEARAVKETETRKLAESALLEAQNKDEAAALAMAEAETATIALTEAKQKRAEAEAATRAAEEKRQEAEIRLTQEIDQRSLLEQLLRELEEKSREQQRARETKELELYDALVSREELEARLKEAESRLMDAGATAIALTESNQKRAEAEAATRAVEEKARKIEALLIEAEALAQDATERHNAAEAKLQYEVKQRALAEQKLKEFEDELSSYLELDWSKSEPDMTQASAARDGLVTNEQTSQLLAQVEVERKARHEAEEARAAIELRMWEMERELSNAEERHHRQEDELRELLRRQELKQTALPEWATVAERKFPALNMAKSGDESPTYSLKKQKGFSYELKFIVYGIVITSLLVAAGWLITELFFRI